MKRQPTKEELKRFFTVVQKQWSITRKRLGTDILPGAIQQLTQVDPNRKHYPHGFLRPNQSPDDVTISAIEFKPILDILREKQEIIAYVDNQCNLRGVDSSILDNFLFDCDKSEDELQKLTMYPISYARARNHDLCVFLYLAKELKERGEIPDRPTAKQVASELVMEMIHVMTAPNPETFLKIGKKTKRKRDIDKYISPVSLIPIDCKKKGGNLEALAKVLGISARSLCDKAKVNPGILLKTETGWYAVRPEHEELFKKLPSGRPKAKGKTPA